MEIKVKEMVTIKSEKTSRNNALRSFICNMGKIIFAKIFKF